jgi:hypothetical protein
MKNKMDTRTFNKVQAFERKHSKALVRWLKLVKSQKENFTWRPDDDDPYAWALYENSRKHSDALSAFEEKADKNVLLTYLKYNPGGRRTYPFTFNYGEGFRDLALEPYEKKKRVKSKRFDFILQRKKSCASN